MLDQFDTFTTIGHGSYGQVYKCIHKDSRKYYAMKKVKFNEVLPTACVVEAAILATFKHPNLLSSAFEFIDSNVIYLVLPLANCDLHTYVTKYSIPLVDRNRPLMVTWMHQLAGALACLHRYKVIHGDIKPSNVLMYDDGVKLCDFSLSVQMPGEDSQYSYTAYSSAYRAPEVIISVISRRENWGISHTWGRPADIWALACTFFEMAYGFFSFQPQSHKELDSTNHYYKMLMYIALRLQNPTWIYTICKPTECDFDPSTPWPDDQTGDPHVNKLINQMLSADPSHRPSIIKVCNDYIFNDISTPPFKVTFPVRDDRSDYPKSPPGLNIPTDVDQIAKHLWSICTNLHIMHKIIVIRVIALKISGNSSHKYVSQFHNLTNYSNSYENAVLIHLNFRVLMRKIT